MKMKEFEPGRGEQGHQHHFSGVPLGFAGCQVTRQELCRALRDFGSLMHYVTE